MAKPKLRSPAGTPPGPTLWSRLFEPVDGASVTFARIAFGLLMAWESYRYLIRGAVLMKYAGPPVMIGYPGLEWIERWPGDGLYWHFYGLAACGLCIALGFCYRAAAALFCLGFTYVLLLSPAWFQNHFYLICLLSLLFSVIPAHGMASVDARLRPRLRSETVPAWSLWVLRAQIGVVYFYGGVAKIQWDWLQGYPMRLWLPSKASLPYLGELFRQDWVAIAMSWSGLCIDLFAAPALLWRRTRPFAFAVLVTFHLWNTQLFRIGVFPWMAIAMTTIFFEPEWPRRILNWPRRGESLHPPFRWTPGRRAIAGFLSVYLAIQVLAPLRHHLYPGDPSWTGEAHGYSWRMMLRKKSGLVTYRVTDPETGRTWLVDPTYTLDPATYGRLSTDPAMIHVYAHEIAEMATEPGHPRVEVRALALATVNDREPEPLIDPEFDLAAVAPRVLRRSPWILPYTKPLGSEWRDKYGGTDLDEGFHVE